MDSVSKRGYPPKYPTSPARKDTIGNHASTQKRPALDEFELLSRRVSSFVRQF